MGLGSGRIPGRVTWPGTSERGQRRECGTTNEWNRGAGEREVQGDDGIRSDEVEGEDGTAAEEATWGGLEDLGDGARDG